ncbi:MAG: MauM/NapG family ferredoxin-type protein [Spirochaetia bacterium]|nr:MauM/NapG family ferredoxin-type protein [Spirochaetia bacterium]
MRGENEKINQSRRDFFRRAILSSVSIVTGFSLFKVLNTKSKVNNFVIRPPGAVNEEEFLSKCIRCIKCVIACPYEVIISADAEDITDIGTPYLNLREGYCKLCADFPCIAACPTDALSDMVKKPKDVMMGTAVITNREACLALRGLRCEVCYRICPFIDEAIVIKERLNPYTLRHTIYEPIVHKEICVGCGRCEQACVLDEAAIEVLPLKRGDISKHYIEAYEI